MQSTIIRNLPLLENDNELADGVPDVAQEKSYSTLQGDMDFQDLECTVQILDRLLNRNCLDTASTEL